MNSRNFLTISIYFLLLTFFGCKGQSHKANDTAPTGGDSSAKSLSVLQVDSTSEQTFQNAELEGDTICDIKFKELSISINRLFVYDEEKKLKETQQDTASIYIELGETLEGQKISVLSNELNNIIVEQRYETSITIMNEGPHCDLTEWKHFYSEWNKLKTNDKGEFIADKYTEKDWVKFPQIKIADLKQKVKEQCGGDWYKLVAAIKTPNEYPSGVGISRYFLRVTGQRKSNGQAVTKLIIIETPMGC